MAEVHGATPQVRLREVEDADLDVLFEHQADPEAGAMAAFPARDRPAFAAHWARVRADDTTVTRTILADGVVAGHIGSWHADGHQQVGYWVGRDHWNRGIATEALTLFLSEVPGRPLVAHVVAHNRGSVRVLEKCGFRRAPALEVPADDGITELVLVLEDLR